MGKSTQRKKAEAVAYDQQLSSILSSHNTRPANYERKFNKRDYGYLTVLGKGRVVKFDQRVNDIKEYALKDLESWRPTSFNERRAVIEFLQYAVCKYQVPSFLYNVFFINGESKFATWFFAIASGKSFYKEISNRFMTKAETHHFINSYDKSKDICENVWRSKILVNGGDLSLVNMFMSTNFSSDSNKLYIPFWGSAILFFVKNRPESSNELQELIDYLGSAYQEDNSFGLKNRTLNSIRNLSNEWHIEQALFSKIDREYKSEWSGINIDDWTYVETYKIGDAELHRTWYINQLLNTDALSREGKEMHHCVGSYATGCANGTCAIFSLSVEDFASGVKRKRELTIEVRPSTFKVVQVRGKFNRQASRLELAVISRWERNHLRSIK